MAENTEEKINISMMLSPEELLVFERTKAFLNLSNITTAAYNACLIINDIYDLKLQGAIVQIRVYKDGVHYADLAIP